MREVARTYGHESGFVRPPGDGAHDFTFRFFVPKHEMEMCAHATAGALWLLARHGRLAGPTVRIATASGSVTGFVGSDDCGGHQVAITQPAGRVSTLNQEQAATALPALGVGPDALAPDPVDVEAACRVLGSTGLYPYAVLDGPGRAFEARQFPRSSGYPEDAATGIAAAALAFGLLHDATVEPDDRPIQVYQGRAMGRLSEIVVRPGFADDRAIGCLIGGEVSAGVQAAL